MSGDSTAPTTGGSPLSDEELIALYKDLHEHPELSFQESRTAGIVEDRLRSWGYDVTTGWGRTGVVGVLENGAGPTALLRADMDALPLEEKTGLDYASTARATDRLGNDVPVMHACGHDVHVACLLGAAARFAAERHLWAGRLMVAFQPAEELGAGAKAMVDDGVFERLGKPDVVLGQHVVPMPAGTLALSSGLALAASDSLTITMHGKGGHGSRPESTVDPIVMAAATVMRLQTIVSRETGGNETAVVTVGMISGGTNNNVIPDQAQLRLSVRTYDPNVRERTLAAIERIAKAEASASNAPVPAEVEHTDHFPALRNDEAAVIRTREAFKGWLGPARVLDPGSMTGSEDVGILAEAAGAPCVFWFLGGADPSPFKDATTIDEALEVLRGLPANHSPFFAPVPELTLPVGVEALVLALRTWLPAG
ncbi:amidohydrolase [Intrasporangium oryzae NRRL B-24470]|uniref:Amidohydrolase n=1 Tax=Intrasporangium oryzae NRRL B-24470 TaxID=1386089 RepID=W9GDN4_9MICO|nr:amidohydrolase [Intrasporangium oryzae]EWT03327.1 amidohydrolase [Intrasporangium oryzae NRRL B-24470]